MGSSTVATTLRFTALQTYVRPLIPCDTNLLCTRRLSKAQRHRGLRSTLGTAVESAIGEGDQLNSTWRHTSSLARGPAARVIHGEWAETRSTPAAVPVADMATLALAACGTIRDCSRAAERLFGYSREELLEQHVSLLLPSLAAPTALLAQGGRVEPRLAYLSRLVVFRARPRAGDEFRCQVCLNSLGNPGVPPLLAIVRRVDPPTRPDR